MTAVRWAVGHVDPAGRRRIRPRDVGRSAGALVVLVLYLAWVLALIWWGGA